MLSISLMSARVGPCTSRHAAGKAKQSFTADETQLEHSDSPNDEQIVLEAGQVNASSSQHAHALPLDKLLFPDAVLAVPY